MAGPYKILLGDSFLVRCHSLHYLCHIDHVAARKLLPNTLFWVLLRSTRASYQTTVGLNGIRRASCSGDNIRLMWFQVLLPGNTRKPLGLGLFNSCSEIRHPTQAGGQPRDTGGLIVCYGGYLHHAYSPNYELKHK